MKTMEELRLEEIQRQKDKEREEARLNEKVLCAELTLPPKAQQALGVTSLYMKLSELADYLEEDFENDERGIYTIKITRRSNRWIENLPEAY